MAVASSALLTDSQCRISHSVKRSCIAPGSFAVQKLTMKYLKSQLMASPDAKNIIKLAVIAIAGTLAYVIVLDLLFLSNY